MRAMILDAPGKPLKVVELSVPEPGPDQLLIKILACAVCRTDLHIAAGELSNPKLPLILGHEIVGKVATKGDHVDGFAIGERVGIPWLGSSCGKCRYCLSGRENLCSDAVFTGYTTDGGFAEYTVVNSRFCFPLHPSYSPENATPLLCAGLIGYRSLVKAGEAERLGIYGFGAAAHIVTQVALYQNRRIFAFTRPGDNEAQNFALQLGAEWAGDSNTPPPEKLDAAIIFAPIGELVPIALCAVCKGGTVVCAGIHMSDIPTFPYEILWGGNAHYVQWPT